MPRWVMRCGVMPRICSPNRRMLPLDGTRPVNGVAQRRLAHAVAADDAEHAARELEAHPLQRMGVAVVDVETFDHQHRPARRRCLVLGTGPGHQCLPPM
jgi:hypothetical protein